MQEEKPSVLQIEPMAYSLNNVNMGFSDELFELVLISGTQGRRYQTSPAQSKRIFLLLQKKIDQYESEYGEIKTALPHTKVSAGAAKEQPLGFLVN